MKAIYLLLSLALVATLSSCANKQKQSNEEQTSSEEQVAEPTTEKAGFTGTYEGTLPCADCPGIKTVLTINDDTTYDLKSEYLEKKDGNFDQSGVYELAHNGEVLVLITPSSGEKIYYRILDGAVALTDETGVLNRGELAEHYILKKK